MRKDFIFFTICGFFVFLISPIGVVTLVLSMGTSLLLNIIGLIPEAKMDVTISIFYPLYALLFGMHMAYRHTEEAPKPQKKKIRKMHNWSKEGF